MLCAAALPHDAAKAAPDTESANESPTLTGIGSLYNECNDNDSDKSNDSDDLQLPPCHPDIEDSLRSISNHHLEEQTGQHMEDKSGMGPSNVGGFLQQLGAFGPTDETQQREEGSEQQDKAAEEYDAQYGLQHEQASDEPEEDTEEDYESPMQSHSRYAGHPLGPSYLDWQAQRVQQEKTQAFWEWAAQFQAENKWTLETSRARAKVLVAEAYFLEKKQLQEQLRWLKAIDCGDHVMTSRFGEHFACPTPVAQGADLPHNLRLDLVQEKLLKLEDRWASVGRQVAAEMAQVDNFPCVIRKLSTMRIFVDGQQSMFYGIDPQERQRRTQLQQSVLDHIKARGDGYFLKDALPRPAPVTPRRRTGSLGSIMPEASLMA